VDLVIGNYFQDGGHILDANAGGIEVMQQGLAKALEGGSKHFFLWQGGTSGENPTVRFTEVKDVVSPEIDHGWTLAIGAADLDGDQRPEIYFAHDFGPDRLMHNESSPGHLRFAELKGHRGFTTPKSCVLGYDSFKGMGCDFADVNGDGFLDIYVSNIADKFALTESHFLWLSTGHIEDMKRGVAPYVQASEKLGLSRSGWGWDCRLADFDNRGDVQAIQAVGFVKGAVNRWPELQSLGTSNSQIVHDPRLWPTFKPGADLSGQSNLDPFFVRAADGRFYDIGPEIGLTEPMVTKAIGIADVDGDGRLDFALGNQWETSFFFRNFSTNVGAFLGLHLLLPLAQEADAPIRERAGHPGVDLHGRPAYGAQAHLTLPGGRKLVGHIDGGSGHSGRRSPDIHLGLGKLDPNAQLDVTLTWRDTRGQFRQTTLKMTPGWHTVLLGDPHATRLAAATPGGSR
jgi:enediyne biosynthesis protein E4